MNRLSKQRVFIFITLLGLLCGLMFFVAPTAGPSVILVWFGLVGATVFVGLQLLASSFSLKWSWVRTTLYTVALLSLIGLSTLDQLTILDVIAVFVLTSLAQLAHQLRVKSK